MATSDQIMALIKSHLKDDDDRFLAVAIQVAAHAARQGHGRVAEEIRVLVDKAEADRKRAARPVPITTPRGELAALLSVSYPETRLSDMVLTEAARIRFDRLLREQRGRQKLLAHGLEPRRKLLLVGPPGSGKTMTASALAGELQVPLYTLLLHGLITKFMGETAAKLRLVFDALADSRGVYLFDEFDAIGGQRAATNDVGEIRRVLNSFLQFLEQDASSSLIIAATNHPEALDRALFRRFDDVIEYDAPVDALALQIMRNTLATFDTAEVDWDLAVSAAGGLSNADITRACELAAKEAVLDDTLTVSTSALVGALEERRHAHTD
ncbi:MAG: ATP-binding protein [Deltaproteobacteria bacterium]|nr:MAG: ATP-binding protein [Deltaproteobacteria bacterium]